MPSHESLRIAAALTRRGGKEAGAAQIADLIVSALQDIDGALSSVIGKGGVAALYRRSLYLTAPAHPQLVDLHEGVTPFMEIAALKSALEQQTSAATAAAGGALLQTFYELLTSLVGPSLTDRLLRATWAKFLEDSPPQENSL